MQRSSLHSMIRPSILIILFAIALASCKSAGKSSCQKSTPNFDKQSLEKPEANIDILNRLSGRSLSGSKDKGIDKIKKAYCYFNPSHFYQIYYICRAEDNCLLIKYVVLEFSIPPWVPAKTHARLTCIDEDGEMTNQESFISGNRQGVLDINVISAKMPIVFDVFSEILGFGGSMITRYNFDGIGLTIIDSTYPQGTSKRKPIDCEKIESRE